MKKIIIFLTIIMSTMSVSLCSANESMTKLLQSSLNQKNFTMAQRAIDNGADVDAVMTSFVLYKEHDNVKFLLKNGANPNHSIRGRRGDLWTPVLSALDVGNLPILDSLLAAGGDLTKSVIDSSGKVQKTSLMVAIDIMNLPPGVTTEKLVKHLLIKGVNVNQTNSWGHTPLMATVTRFKYSRKNEGVAIAKLLLNAGVDPNAKDDRGQTALDYAIHDNYSEMVELLFPITKLN